MPEKQIDYQDSSSRTGLERFPEISTLQNQAEQALQKTHEIAAEINKREIGLYSCALQVDERLGHFYKFILWQISKSQMSCMDEDSCANLLENFDNFIKEVNQALNDLFLRIQEFDNPDDVLKGRMRAIENQLPGASVKEINQIIVYHDISLMHLKNDGKFTEIFKLFLETLNYFINVEKSLDNRINSTKDDNQCSELINRREEQAIFLSMLLNYKNQIITAFNYHKNESIALALLSNVCLIKYSIELSQLYLRLFSQELDKINRADWEIIKKQTKEVIESTKPCLETLMKTIPLKGYSEDFDPVDFTTKALRCDRTSHNLLTIIADLGNLSIKVSELGGNYIEQEYPA